MDADQIKNWKKERDIARAIQDPTARAIALEAVYDHRDDMQMECIQHQADRIKTSLANDAILDKDIKQVKSELASMKKELAPCVESDKDYRSWKLKIQGGVLLWRILKYLVAAGCGGIVWQLLTSAAK